MRCKAGMLGANKKKGWNPSSIEWTGSGFSPYLITNRSPYFPRDLFVTKTGDYLFVAASDDYVEKYELTTPWDLSTYSLSESLSVASQETQLMGIFFKPDGLKMFACGFAGDDVNEYALSVAWDLSTASHVTQKSLNSGNPRTLRFAADGTHMLTMHQLPGIGSGYEQGRVSQYSLTSAWDISSATHFADFNFPTTTASGHLQPASFDVHPSGKTLFYGANWSGRIFEYELAQPWDISTPTYVRASAFKDNFGGIVFGNDGASLYLGDTIALNIREYTSI